LGGPAPPSSDHFLPLLYTEFRRQFRMLRTVQDNVARARRVRIVKRERGEVVGIEMNVVVVRNLPRSGAERAPIRGHLRTILTVRRDHHPLLENWMPAKLAHDPYSH